MIRLICRRQFHIAPSGTAAKEWRSFDLIDDSALDELEAWLSSGGADESRYVAGHELIGESAKRTEVRQLPRAFSSPRRPRP